MNSPVAPIALAAAVGVLFVAQTFPAFVLLGQTPDSMLVGDLAAHVIGQRYFLADAWHWPLPLTRLLAPPEGVNIIFTDSIPLTALPAKLLRVWLPRGFTTILPFLAFCYVAQPVSAVVALRCAGETRLVPALTASVMAISMPALLHRCGQVALCAHFLILLALAVYFSEVRTSFLKTRSKRLLPPGFCAAEVGVNTATLPESAEKQKFFGSFFQKRTVLSFFLQFLLLTCSLLIHPYLLVMVTAILAAAPLSLLLSRQPRWRRATVSLALGCLLTACLAILLGYGGAAGGGGFGQASMNLASPVYPAYSFLLKPLFPWAGAPIDANGFQAGGYQYLGLGLLILVAVGCVALCRRGVRPRLGRHAGLCVICMCLFMFALSNVVYAGHSLLIRLGDAPAILENLRASNRFFWPVSYALLIAASAAVARAFPYRPAAAVLLICAAAQYADATYLRSAVAAFAAGDVPFLAGGAVGRALRAQQAITQQEGGRLRILIARHDRLTIWPTAECGTSEAATPEFLPLLVAASDVPVPVNTMYLARGRPRPECDTMQAAGRALDPGELRVFMPDIAAAAPLIVPDGSRFCRALGRLALCSLSTGALAGLAAPAPGTLPLETKLSAQDAARLSILGAGWTSPGPDGVWSLGHDATLAGRFASAPAQPVTLTVWGHGFTGRGGAAQLVRVSVNALPVAVWQVETGSDRAYTAILPPAVLAGGTALIRFAIATPERPMDAGINEDSRLMGLFMQGAAFGLARP